MSEFNLNIATEDYIIVKKVNDTELAWQAPRGYNVNDPKERWTPNPDKAHVYKDLAAAINAVKRLKDDSPEEFDRIKIIPIEDFRKTNEKYQHYNLTEFSEYHPKYKKVYVLEQGDKTYFFASKERRNAKAKELKEKGEEHHVYDLRR